MDTSESFLVAGGLVGFAIMLALYLLPTFIACVREHNNFVPILIVNLFLGWTVLGWIAALVWCFTAQTERQ